MTAGEAGGLLLDRRGESAGAGVVSQAAAGLRWGSVSDSLLKLWQQLRTQKLRKWVFVSVEEAGDSTAASFGWEQPDARWQRVSMEKVKLLVYA